MANLTIHLPDKQYERLKQYAQTRKVSVNTLIEELLTIALAKLDVHAQYKAMSATGNPQLSLEILDKLDAMTG